MHHFIKNLWIKSGLILCLLVLDATAIAAVQTCNKTNIVASTLAAEFIDNNDGTVTHSLTGLMWKRCSEGQTWDATGKTCTGTGSVFIWRLALQEVASINVNNGGFAGHTDWRLPNVKELLSIVENQCVVPAINQLLFPALPSTLEFWTGTPSLSDPASAWAVEFNGGRSDFFSKSNVHSIRLVRNAP